MYEELINKALQHLQAIADPAERIFSLYLLGAILVALINWLILKKTSPASGNQNFLHYIFKSKNYTHRSSRQDYFLFVSNSFVFTAALAGVLIGAPEILEITLRFLSDFTGRVPQQQATGFTVYWAIAFTIVTLLCMDFSVFFTHYLMHKVPLLWEFHKVHHSAEVLNPITLYRQHPVDLLLTAGFYAVLLGMVYGVFIFLSGAQPAYFQVLGINIFVFIYYLFGYNLRHSDIWVHYPRWMTAFLVSPAQHQVHHSQDPKHFDKNMGLIFSFWDRMFGTLYVPVGYEKISYGINRSTPNPFQSWSSLYLDPFRQAWKVFRNGKAISIAGYVTVSLLLLYGLLYMFMELSQRQQGNWPPAVHTEELTWREIDQLVLEGYKSLIIPTGGIEQNGPHLPTGKHGYVVKYTSGEIATKLGGTLVAPVINFVPEQPHIDFPGTIHVPEETFKAILIATIESFARHGFTDFYLLGDSAGNQAPMKNVASEYIHGGRSFRVFHIDSYYAGNNQFKWLMDNGFSKAEIGYHAGIRDTSEMLSIREDLVTGRLLQRLPSGNDYSGNPSLATRAIGESLVQLKVNAALRQINELSTQ